MSKIIKQKIPYGKKSINILTNASSSKKMLIFFHGLDGSASSAKPLFENLPNYKIVAVEQRGHTNSQINSSRFIKKHLEDYLTVIKYFFNQGYKIWLLGESMGASYVTLLGYLKNQMIQGIFAQSIPNKIVDVLIMPKIATFKIKFMTFISFLTNINYKYIAMIDYEKFSSNKSLHRVARIADRNKKRHVRETLATWAANRRVWKYLKRKKPFVPIWYFQPTNDVTNNLKNIDKIFNNRHNLTLIKAEGAKHILMYEPQFKDVLKFIDQKISEQN